MLRSTVVVVLLVAGGALAQTPATTPTAPPLVPATPPPAPPPEPGVPPVSNQPGTPPPPAAGPAYIPGSQQNPSGYQYSPYGQPRAAEKPGPEIGLMLSESLFGMLTAAGITVLPYFLLFGNGGVLGGDQTVSSIIFILIFAASPLAVAQTQVGLANGSRYYMTETWPAALAGLAAEAGVLGLFYATGWLPTQTATGGVPTGGSVALLLIGAIGVVPLVQMAVINLFKVPKFRPVATTNKPGEGIALAPPMLAPMLPQTSIGATSGMNLSLLNGTW